MKPSLNIAHIVPGSGGTFYCQNCIRDLALVPALRELGLDAYILPLYLPLQATAPDVFKDETVFFGAVNLYLTERFPLLNRLTKPLAGLLDSQSLLNMAAKKSGTTRAEGLEDMTISMLKGSDGNQKDALGELVRWLTAQPSPPDIIHISNALLIGMAPALKSRFHVPIICSLQDELGWIETMHPDYTEEVWALMQQSVPHVTAFSCVSQYYADAMKERLQIPPEKLHVIPIGVSLQHFYPLDTPKTGPPTIGYVSKLSPQYGLDRLIDAFIQLKSEHGLTDLRLRATGGMTEDVQPFLKECELTLTRLGIWDDVDFVEDFGEDARGDFLRSLDILSVPVPGGEAFGTYQLEAMACGVPVVQPRAGAFTEVVEDTGGGVLYSPDEPTGLTDSLRALLQDPDRARELGTAGLESVRRQYTIQEMAKATERLYETVMEAANVN